MGAYYLHIERRKELTYTLRHWCSQWISDRNRLGARAPLKFSSQMLTWLLSVGVWSNLHHRSWTVAGCYTWYIHLIKITIFSIENSDNYWWSSFGHRDLIRNESFNTFDGFEFIHQEDFWDCWTKDFVVHLGVGFMVYTYLLWGP